MILASITGRGILALNLQGVTAAEVCLLLGVPEPPSGPNLTRDLESARKDLEHTVQRAQDAEGREGLLREELARVRRDLEFTNHVNESLAHWEETLDTLKERLSIEIGKGDRLFAQVAELKRERELLVAKVSRYEGGLA